MRKVGILFLALLGFSLYGLSQTDKGQVATLKKEITVNNKVKVFPNPATNVVNILGLKNSMKAEILISDVYGNVVLSHQWEIRNNALNIPISILKSGVYIIAIRSGEEKVQTKFYKR